MEKQIGRQRVQEGVGKGHGELIIRPLARMKVKVRVASGLPSIKRDLDIAQGQLLAQPMHVALDLRHVKVPPFKGPAGQIEMQVSIFLSAHGDGAVDMRDWWLLELISFDGADDMGADGARNHHRLGGAEAISEVYLLREKIHA